MYMFVFEVVTVYIICSHATCKGEGVFLTRVVPSSLSCASLCAYTTRCGSYTWDAATRSCHLHTQGDTETKTMPHAKYLKESQRMVYRDHQCEGNKVCVPVEAWTKFTRVASTAALSTTTTTTPSSTPSAATTIPSITPTLTTTKSRFQPAFTTTMTLSATTATTPSATTATTTTTTAPSTTQSATTTTTTSPPPTSTTTTTTLTPRTTTTTNPPSPTTTTGTTTTPSDTTTTNPSPTTTTTTTPSPTTTTTTPSPATTTTTPSPSTTITIPSPTTTIPTTLPTTTTNTPCPATVNQANVPYTYVGCYQGNSDHVLPYSKMVDRTCLTTETCKLHCHGMNRIYFGTRGGCKCFCGDVIQDGYKKKPDSECNYPCPGDRSTMCGGQGRISIYKIG